MPTPNSGESRKDFVNRCIPYLINEGKHPNTDKGRSDAAGECYGIYDSWKKENNSQKSERIHMNLCANIFNETENLSMKKDFNRATLIVGDGTYNGIFFPAEELEKAYLTWERQPINLDHSEKVEDEIGYVTDVKYDPLTKSITGKPVINDYMPKSNVARGFLQNRFAADKTPEGSIGVWMDKNFEEMGDGKMRLTGRNLQGDHYALVTRGACSPEQGCGIGLSENMTIPIVVYSDNNIGNGLQNIIISSDDKEWFVDEKIKDKLNIEIEIEKEKIKGGKN